MRRIRRHSEKAPAFAPYTGVRRLLAQSAPASAPIPVPAPAPALGQVREVQEGQRGQCQDWRPSWEEEALAWAKENAPALAAWVLAAEERCKLAWAWEPWAEEEAWAEWELARRELRAAWERATGQGQQGQGWQQGEQCQERELGFEEAEAAWGGFERVWDLTDAQAASLDRLFNQKGPVLVRTARGWLSAEEWQEKLERLAGRRA
ncbi:hypothetical protein [Desulfovirgula thermocuniculi]|uniref:hypothetical protein n=1 Tax=Desulfovirgula thermocuniculi TaxID=348842 RepID=UPI0012EBFF86|nr:hypothetical protein [Desulfovirgula thermocuniculi]